jgi:sucrose-6-phosphate hydrolase SacC (GH32 family)
MRLLPLALLLPPTAVAGSMGSPPSQPGYPPVPIFLPHFTPALHLPTTYGSGAQLKADGMQDPAGNLQLADGTFHVFPCCQWEHFSSTDLVHWDRVGRTNLGGGTGSMAIREDNSVVAMRPSRGMSMSVSDDSAACAGHDCLSNWTDLGSVLSAPPGGSSAGFRDPARPWKSDVDGHWYQVMGGGQRGAEAQGLLYRAANASLMRWDFVTQVLTANRTTGFGKNEGFFDMMECPDFFPLGPKQSQRWVFISSCYLGKSPIYPADGFHNSVTWWVGTWSPTANDAKMVVEASGLVDWGAVTYYSAKSLAGPNDDEPTRLLGGWVMDSNGASEPRLCKNRDPSPNGLAWVICPEALHREVYLCTNRTTAKPAMCQRPAPQLQALRAEQPVSANISTCGHPATTNYSLPLPISGLQLELHLNLSFCKGVAAAAAVTGEVGLGVLASPSGDEITRIGYNLASRTLFIDRDSSSTLPAARPGGGALKSTGKQGYGIRAREVAPLPEVTAFDNRNHPTPSDADSLQLVVLLDHSILTVFANDAAVITTRIYTAAGGNASGAVSFFAEGMDGAGVKGSVTVWPLSLKSDDASAVPPPPCSLNGALATPAGDHGAEGCVCDAGWTGAHCGQLDLLPAPPLEMQVTGKAATTTSNDVANSTWGMSVLGPDPSGMFHGYMTEIANHCPLGDYGTASQIAHMTASSPLGPWRRVGIALAGFAHNPQAVMWKESILLFHIGKQLPEGCLKNCTPGSAGSLAPVCPRNPHATSVAVAKSFDGPWTRHDFILGNAPTNPAPFVLSNGTIILGTRRKASNEFPTWVGHASSPAGPWVPLATTVVSTPGGSLSVSEEDSFIWAAKRGYHMLTHRAVHGSDGWPPKPSTGCGGGHLYSHDLLTWFVGENAFGHSPNASAQCDLQLSSGKIRLTSRQRPTVLQTATGRRFLFTGASGPEANTTEYQHSFTLVQEIKTT